MAFSPYKRFTYLLEYILVLFLYYFFRLFPLSIASSIGGKIGRLILQFVRVQVTHKNLNQAIKGLDPSSEKLIIKKFHNNYGRNFAEYFFLDRLDKEPSLKVTFKTPEILEQIRQNNRPKILITAHYGNWEIALWGSNKMGLPLIPIYRHLNNPYINAFVLKMRGTFAEQQIQKGPRSGKEALKALKQGKNLVLLVDQKMQEGLPIPFFGKKAMTPSGAIKLALLSQAQIIPVRIIRKKNIDFDMFLEAPIEYDKTCPHVEQETLLKINQILEKWIIQHPEQWFWFHDRWEKSFYEEF